MNHLINHSERGEDLLYEHYRIKVDPGQTPYRIDRFICDKIGGISRHRVQGGIKQGCVQVNGKPVKANYKVRPGDLIQLLLPTPPRMQEVLPEAIPLDIVYEDADLLVVNKPAEMVVHPGFGHWNGTLANALLHHVEQLPTSQGREGRPGLVHRIDKGTSGLLVVAKHEEALSGLAKQFFEHSVERTYWALVWGTPPTQGTIDLPTGRSLHDRRIMAVYPEGTRGKRSVTHYKVEEVLGYVSLISCQLETGRTHQIRVHMAHLGHPIFGDTRYGGDQICYGPRFSKYKAFISNNLRLMPYQALHAQSLGFIHPKTRKRCFFEAPLPGYFKTLIERWRRYVPSV